MSLQLIAKKAANVYFSRFNCVFFLYFSLNFRHNWMPDIHCGKQTKLSKTMVSPLDTMGEIISSQCPYDVYYTHIILPFPRPANMTSLHGIMIFNYACPSK